MMNSSLGVTEGNYCGTSARQGAEELDWHNLTVIRDELNRLRIVFLRGLLCAL